MKIFIFISLLIVYGNISNGADAEHRVNNLEDNRAALRPAHRFLSDADLRAVAGADRYTTPELMEEARRSQEERQRMANLLEGLKLNEQTAGAYMRVLLAADQGGAGESDRARATAMEKAALVFKGFDPETGLQVRHLVPELPELDPFKPEDLVSRATEE
jgi:hypothetical protein